MPTGDSVFKKTGLKNTPNREALLKVLEGANKPLSPQDIFEKINGKGGAKGVDRVTVYRTIEAFLKAGLVKRVATGEREAVYELNKPHDDHHHVICLSCKKVEDFTGCDADTLVAKALKQVKNFKTVSHHSFDIYGLCTSCAR